MEASRVTRRMGRRKTYLGDQLYRAAVSTALNIVEGVSRRTSKDKAHKYTIALAECQEVAACLRLADALHVGGDTEGALRLAARVSMMLLRLIERFGRPSA